MLNRLRGKVALIVCTVLPITGFVSGIALASCDGNYCNQSTANCSPVGLSMQDTCCVDLDGNGIFHCADCWRDYWYCSGSYMWGPAYSCTYNGGAQCS